MIRGVYLGIDFGTSGARAIAIDAAGIVQVEVQVCYETAEQNLAASWQNALFQLIEKIPVSIRQQVEAIAFDGTSSTVLLCNDSGTPVVEPLRYDDARGEAVIEQLKAIAPPHHLTLSATSSLAKLLWWQKQLNLTPASISQPLYFLHQADWLAFKLHGKLGISDYHNALKLGYDVTHLHYPDWLNALQIPVQLPEVLAPGTPVQELLPEIAKRFSFPQHCLVCAGTTDSIAAFLASGAKNPGEAVTSLGSTLVLKLLSETPVNNVRYGIYSHRLGDLWLVGGASNTGGAVLRQFFTDLELAEIGAKINPQIPSQLDYYPLLKPGDRFPVNEPNLPPKLDPKPDSKSEFLHGILEGIARIEQRGYQLLQELGATQLTTVYTAGGGAKNQVWQAIRARYLQVSMPTSIHAEAAYGAALLSQEMKKKA